MKYAILALAMISSPVLARGGSVRGYTRGNGTYVAPHVRSAPDGAQYNNYSYRPSQRVPAPSPYPKQYRPYYGR